MLPTLLLPEVLGRLLQRAGRLRLHHAQVSQAISRPDVVTPVAMVMCTVYTSATRKPPL